MRFLTPRETIAIVAAMIIAARTRGPERGPYNSPLVLNARDFAAEVGINIRYMEPAFADLTRAGILIGRQGGAGGYRLAKSADRISVADVLDALDRRAGDASDIISGPPAVRVVTDLIARLTKPGLDSLRRTTVGDLADCYARRLASRR